MGRRRKHTDKWRKWRPRDGAPEFQGIPAEVWGEIAPDLPHNAPDNARELIEARGRRLWDLRANRIVRPTADQLAQCADWLRAGGEHCRSGLGSDVLANRLEIAAAEVMREADRARLLAQNFARLNDPDRAEFQLGIVWDYRQWGGDLGEPLPSNTVRYFFHVNQAVLGDHSPARASCPRLIRLFRRIALIEPGEIAGSLTDQGHHIFHKFA